jgi:hypothetical protein
MGNFVIGVLTLLAIYFVVSWYKSSSRNSGTPGGSSKVAATKNGKTAVAPRSPWRATSIVHDAKACNAVKAIGGRRFLDTEKQVPKLPLPECDVERCNCKYVHHEDRRDVSEDRRSPNALHAELYDRSGQVNRRERKRGRRKTDWS